MINGLHAHLLDTVTPAVIATDLEGCVTYWNRFAEQLYGWSAKEALGRHVLDLPHAAEWRKEGSAEFHVRDRHGRSFLASVTNWPLLDEHNKLTGVIGVSSDVTEMRRVQDELRAREKQLADAQRLAHVGTVERNHLTGSEVWTDEVYRIFEIDPSIEYSVRISKTLRDILPQEPEVQPRPEAE